MRNGVNKIRDPNVLDIWVQAEEKKTLVSLFLLSLLSSTPTSQRFVVHCDTHFRLMLRSHSDDSFFAALFWLTVDVGKAIFASIYVMCTQQ